MSVKEIELEQMMSQEMDCEKKGIMEKVRKACKKVIVHQTSHDCPKKGGDEHGMLMAAGGVWFVNLHKLLV